MNADALIQHAIELANSGNRAEAKKIFSQVLQEQPKNARVWLLLSYVMDTQEQVAHCLHKALEIDPGYTQAQQRLQSIQEKKRKPPAVVPAKKNAWGKWVLVVGGLLVLACCFLVFLANLINGSNSQDTTSLTNTPAFFVRMDEREHDGVTFGILDTKRRLDANDPSFQSIYITILLASTDVPWVGFDVRNTELILDDETGNRHSAKSVSPICDIYDDEKCETEAEFRLPSNISNFILYYVSDKSIDKQPIEVNEPENRRFIAEINLENVGFEPTITTAPSPKPSMTPIPTATIPSTAPALPTEITNELPTKTPTQEKKPAGLLPGLRPEVVRANLEAKNLACELVYLPSGNDPYYKWECKREGLDYMINVEMWSKSMSTVDLIQAGIVQYGNPDNSLSVDFLGFMATMPYDGADPQQARSWVKETLPTITEKGDVREITIGGVRFRLYGIPSARFLDIGEDLPFP